MKLTEKAIAILQPDNDEAREKRLKLALALGFSEVWIERLIENNKNNGPLITVKAVGVIKSETGLNESEILEESEVNA